MPRGQHMKERYGSLDGSFSTQLQQFAETAKEAMDLTFRDVVFFVGQRLVTMSPIDTGRFRSNWQLTAGAPAVGEIEEIQSADETLDRLFLAAGDLSAGEVAYIVNNLPYAVPLEYGHSTQAPAGMVRVTIADFQNIVNRVIEARKE
ncbi:HK97 gp10 family phage protein [Pseudomonas guariconensis]|uniref:HK97 gp10 family phage protein n=1 Tax=Pseudomonas guariconensis TaxID=1288410 RepID=UPI0018D8751B|nr:HK97 gp10 family phage protein [Pseudomonas guariconensis]MBH3360447.1 HK97 gp10 family phage protein [Pseudomonas guariconensis]